MATYKDFDPDRNFSLHYWICVAIGYGGMYLTIKAADYFLPLPQQLVSALHLGALLGIGWMGFIYFLTMRRP
ncbi:MAG: hypothetical protein AAGF86_21175 [Pseudomonadota bacterium]